MTDSSQPEWKRSSIGITPLTVRPRAGSRRIKKFDVVGTGTTEQQASNGAHVNIIFPGVSDRGGGAGTSLQADGRRVCSVCTRASADYSCPRCLIGYCSSKCYKVRYSSSCVTRSSILYRFFYRRQSRPLPVRYRYIFSLIFSIDHSTGRTHI